MNRRRFIGNTMLALGALAINVKYAPALALDPARPLGTETPVDWQYLLGNGDQSKVATMQDGSIVCSTGENLTYVSAPVSGDFSVIFETDCPRIGVLGILPEIITGENKDATGIFIEQGIFSPFPDQLTAEGQTTLRKPKIGKQKFEIRVVNHQVNYFLDDKFWCRSEQTAQVKPLTNTVRISAGFNNVYKEIQAFLRVRIVK